MNFSIAHKTFSVTLSFLVLVSSLSLTIEKHFCGETLVDVAIFSDIEKCADDVVKTDATSVVKKTCCKDEIDVIAGLSEITINSFEDLDSIHQQILFAYSYSYISLFEGLPKLIIPHEAYTPPKLIKDIQVLDETYLI
ncbi:hypothetical protein HNV08_12850 [Winogradskyella eckloniae]|uniref:HYC_CC_PP family protein n=1 Tax=Winogradskyella eckloniae TaxID=1089306 RepID=UPI001567A018|nr:hypothetical protein [Winogradskyella eckloniae]NRD20938.1 hypothetical protein [Winogradskyella eckloniae]